MKETTDVRIPAWLGAAPIEIAVPIITAMIAPTMMKDKEPGDFAGFESSYLLELAMRVFDTHAQLDAAAQGHRLPSHESREMAESAEFAPAVLTCMQKITEIPHIPTCPFTQGQLQTVFEKEFGDLAKPEVIESAYMRSLTILEEALQASEASKN